VCFISINRSYTDPFRQGIRIPLYKAGYAICPVLAVSRHFQLSQSLKSSDTDDKKPLTRQFFIKHIKLLLDKSGLANDYNGHSFICSCT